MSIDQSQLRHLSAAASSFSFFGFLVLTAIFLCPPLNHGFLSLAPDPAGGPFRQRRRGRPRVPRPRRRLGRRHNHYLSRSEVFLFFFRCGEIISMRSLSVPRPLHQPLPHLFPPQSTRSPFAALHPLTAEYGRERQGEKGRKSSKVPLFHSRLRNSFATL